MRFLLLIIFLFSFNAHAINTEAIEQQAAKEIMALYQHPDLPSMDSLPKRIDWFSQHFLGRPYILFSLGEGISGEFDQYPRYRMDGFDCLTYVETVLALALAHDFSSFDEILRHIRYANGEPDYLKRNHFTDLDWNQNNATMGFIEDITQSMMPEAYQLKLKKAVANIDKANWYSFKKADSLRISDNNSNNRDKLIDELHRRGRQFEPSKAVVFYIPLDELFSSNGKANMQIFNKIPHTAIIEIVRPDWAIEHIIGTRLNISHLGFAIWKDGKLYFREASSNTKRVQETLLVDYLDKARSSPTIKGINIQMPKESIPKNLPALK